jgi:hypothetical protein
VNARSLKLVAAVGVVTILAIALFPELAHACDTCFDQKEKNRLAFFTTTIFLSGLPLGMIAGTTYWMKRKNHEADQ